MAASTGLPFEPRADGRCRVCGNALEPETLRCSRCGTVHGSTHRCPHCSTVATVDPDPILGLRCSVCGKPRLPHALGQLDQPEVAQALRQAGAARRDQLLFLAGSWGALGIGFFALLSTLALLKFGDPSTATSIIAVLLTALPLGASLLSRHRAQARVEQRTLALTRARAKAIGGLIRELGTETSSTELARRSGLTPDETEKALIQLSLDDTITSRVSDEGELLYSAASPARLRVSLEEEFDGLEAETASLEEGLAANRIEKRS